MNRKRVRLVIVGFGFVGFLLSNNGGSKLMGSTLGDTKVMDGIKKLVAQKKYLSAIKAIHAADPKGLNSDYVLEECQVAREYYEECINFQIFGFRDLGPNENLDEVRGTPGTYEMLVDEPEKLLKAGIARDPRNAALKQELALYYLDGLNVAGSSFDPQEKDPHGAAIKILADIRAQPGALSADGWKELGINYTSTQDYADGLPCFRAATRLDPTSGDDVYNEAVCLFNLERDKKALPLAEKSVELYGAGHADLNSIVDAWGLCAELRRSSGDKQGSYNALRAAFKLRPDDYWSTRRLMDFHLKDGLEGQARKDAARIFAMQPTNPRMPQDILDLFGAVGKTSDAVDVLAGLVPLYQDQQEAVGNLEFHMGDGYAQLDKSKEAHQAWLAAKAAFLKASNPNQEAVNAVESRFQN
ncbi:MAG TPA: hypothetical protein VK914_01995 [bacterium]|jgi:tetratricopeptide (TPR) repeat protein|nr:hypothetical protein [bacterium]